MTDHPCRWGILGAANIARKNWQAIRDAGNARLVAVASRDAQRAARFVAECQAAAPHPETPVALGSYEDLLARPDIDAVYLPLPTGLRRDWILRAVEAGKHVLAEKPAARDATELGEILDACDRRGLQFMDGVMFMHCRRLGRLREILDDGSSVGRVRRITTQFSFAGGEEFLHRDIRTDPVLEPLGCLGDLGWYCIRFALWAMDEIMPSEVTGRIHSEAGRGTGRVPAEFSGELLFPGGASASFHCSFIAENAEWAVVSGTRGYLHVPDFVLPFAGAPARLSVTRSEFRIEGCRFDMRENRTDECVAEPSNNAPGSPEAVMFHTFSDLVRSGRRDPRWPEIARKTQRVTDACLRSASRGSAAVRPD